MVLLFNVGDIVWSKSHRYSVTFYHRPCKLLTDFGEDGTIRVEVLDNGCRFDVEKKMNLSLYHLVEY